MGFPEEIVTFPTMLDMTVSDGELIKQYQDARQRQDAQEASSVLLTIPNYEQKIITAQYLNKIATTCQQVQRFYAEKYNPAYVVSVPEPSAQEVGDFWFQVTGTA